MALPLLTFRPSYSINERSFNRLELVETIRNLHFMCFEVKHILDGGKVSFALLCLSLLAQSQLEKLINKVKKLADTSFI